MICGVEPSARFDDLGPNGRSFRLRDAVEVFVATCAADVATVLAAAEEAARAGRWVAGFVAYEAAAGLDLSLPVVPRTADDPLADLPLAWFAAFERREEVPPVGVVTCCAGPDATGRPVSVGEWLVASAVPHPVVTMTTMAATAAPKRFKLAPWKAASHDEG